jgi:hypothetical protein
VTVTWILLLAVRAIDVTHRYPRVSATSSAPTSYQVRRYERHRSPTTKTWIGGVIRPNAPPTAQR